MKYESKVQAQGQVSFPDFQGERVYMLPFYQKEGLPENLKRWQDTVDQMLAGLSTDEVIYLMIDQGFVKSGRSHRRPGLHIDGYWNPARDHEGHGGKSSLVGVHGSHKSSSLVLGSHGGHRSNTYLGSHGNGGHGSKQNKGSHGSGGHESKAFKGTHGSGHGDGEDGKAPWETASFKAPEALILASNITAARGFNGSFDGPIKHMGDCSHVDTNGLEEVVMEAGRAYLGNITFLHESLPLQKDCFRTLVRLNVPGLSF